MVARSWCLPVRVFCSAVRSFDVPSRLSFPSYDTQKPSRLTGCPTLHGDTQQRGSGYPLIVCRTWPAWLETIGSSPTAGCTGIVTLIFWMLELAPFTIDPAGGVDMPHTFLICPCTKRCCFNELGCCFPPTEACFSARLTAATTPTWTCAMGSLSHGWGSR